ncbi:MAG: hypothetical protein ACHQ49_10345, partial [Elusimicrobiota bacterium]
MTRFAQSRLGRTISLFLAFAILHAVPGLQVYQAAAQVLAAGSAAGTAGAPVRVSLPIAAAGSNQVPTSRLSAPSLPASFFAPSAPGLAPAAAPAAASAQASAAATAFVPAPAALTAPSAAALSHA